MLKEPTEVSFFAIQVNFPFLGTNFTWSKIWQRSLKLTETVPRKPVLTKLYYMT